MKKMAGILAGVFFLTAFSGCGLLDFLNKEEKSYKDKVAEKLSLDFSEEFLQSATLHILPSRFPMAY